MGERVAAVPSRLLELSRAAAAAHDDLARAAADLGAALDLVRHRCPDHLGPLPDADGEIHRVAARAGEIAGAVHAVATAIALAGAGVPGAVVQADSTAVDGALAAGWRPQGNVRRGSAAAWWTAVYGTRCSRAGWFYAGGGGFITGPDGRQYALVAPTVVRNGLAYNADWGRGDGPGVLDLLGGDPGWRTIDVETGVERHRAAPALWERLLIGAGSTVGGPVRGSTRRDVDSVILEVGARPRIGVVPPEWVEPEPVPPDRPPERPLPTTYNVAALAPMAADFSVGALTADHGAHHAYQVVFQENVDGRRRALYERVDVLPGDGEHPTALAASYVTGPDAGADRVPIRYLGPDTDVVSDAHPEYVVVDPAPGLVPGDA